MPLGWKGRQSYQISLALATTTTTKPELKESMNVTWNGGSLWGRRSFFQRKSGCSGPLFSQSHTVQNGGKRLLVFGIRRARRHAQKRNQPLRLQHSYQPIGLLGARRGLIAQIRRQSTLPI